MASITSATVTLRGKVNSRVVTLYADGAEVTLASDQTFAYVVAVTTDRLVMLTTIDAQGLSETRAVRIESESVPYVAPVPV